MSTGRFKPRSEAWEKSMQGRAELNRRIVGDMAVAALKHDNELSMKVAHARVRLISLSEVLDKYGLAAAAQSARAILETLQ
jgi:hypothetical protein